MKFLLQLFQNDMLPHDFGLIKFLLQIFQNGMLPLGFGLMKVLWIFQNEFLDGLKKRRNCVNTKKLIKGDSQ